MRGQNSTIPKALQVVCSAAEGSRYRSLQTPPFCHVITQPFRQFQHMTPTQTCSSASVGPSASRVRPQHPPRRLSTSWRARRLTLWTRRGHACMRRGHSGSRTMGSGNLSQYIQLYVEAMISRPVLNTVRYSVLYQYSCTAVRYTCTVYWYIAVAAHALPTLLPTVGFAGDYCTSSQFRTAVRYSCTDCHSTRAPDLYVQFTYRSWTQHLTHSGLYG